MVVAEIFLGMDTLSREKTVSKLFLLPSEKWSALVLILCIISLMNTLKNSRED